MAEVRLVDLDIIKRYSLAVRQEKATADELLAALDASRAAVEAAIEAESTPRAGRRRSAAVTSSTTETS